MKIFSLVVLSLLAIPAYAQGFLDSLEQHQASLPTPAGITTDRPSTGVTTPTTRPSDVDTSCSEDKQTSLPLKYLTGLILERDAKLDINHDPASGTLRISSPSKMIGNCNSMLQWNLSQNEVDGKKTYSIEVKFKDGETCTEDADIATGKMCYRVAKMKDGSFDRFEVKPFSNDIQGFQKCLEHSGVVGADRKINTAAIFKQPVQESFSGLDETGRLVFLSHGPVSSQVDPRFALDRVNRCDVYEQIHPTISMVYSPTDINNQRLEAEAETLRNCQPNEYQRLVDFIERNNYQGNLAAIRDNLILKAAQETAKKIAENKELTEDDLKVISDFERYIVEPKRKEVADQFLALENLEGTELQAGRARLATLRTELEAFARAPYFQRVHVEKLIASGKFADAEKMEGIRIAISESAKIGKTENNQVITPDMARIKIAQSRGALADRLVTASENYDIRTGVTTGLAQSYRDLATAMRRNINVRNQNYSQEIQAEYARIQQGGYCYRYFRNTQRCIQDSLQRIQELQTALAHYNRVDTERAAEYDQKATQYGQMEAEGRTYVARQNGEEAPREPAQDTTVVAPREEDPAITQGGQQLPQQSMMPPWMQNPQTPYGNQGMMSQPQNPYGQMYGQQQQPFMGQSGFNAQFGYQGTMGQNFMGQQQQYGNVGVNWLAMGQGGFGGGQQYGQQQPMFGQQFGQQPFGQQQFGWGPNPMMAQSPYGQIYGQSPYGGQQSPWAQQAYGYPNLYGR